MYFVVWVVMTSDIIILSCFRKSSTSQNPFYRTWRLPFIFRMLLVISLSCRIAWIILRLVYNPPGPSETDLLLTLTRIQEVSFFAGFSLVVLAWDDITKPFTTGTQRITCLRISLAFANAAFLIFHIVCLILWFTGRKTRVCPVGLFLSLHRALRL